MNSTKFGKWKIFKYEANRLKALWKRFSIVIGLLTSVNGLLTSVTGVLASLSSIALAHESRPLFVEITEISERVFRVRTKFPPALDTSKWPRVIFPDSCTELGKSDSKIGSSRFALNRTDQQMWRCTEGLEEMNLLINYPEQNFSISTLFRYTSLSGVRHIKVLNPRERSWLVPRAQTKSQVAWDYSRMGVSHIWAGPDHLLFLVCLIWIAGSFKRVLITITGFTLAHSLTLVLSALNLVRLPLPPTEAVIALSVLFLASEIARDDKNTVTWRYPIAVSVLFGLLHGLGFAAVLNEIGLPQIELATGLLFFNVGVEIGQILFVSLALIAMHIILKSSARVLGGKQGQRALRTGMSYVVGCLASFWLIQRTAEFIN